MSTRQFIYETLSGYTPIQTLVADRVFQGESLRNSMQAKPFLVYRMGNDTDLNFAERDAFPHQWFFQVHAHDEPADYSQVDNLITLSIASFRAAIVPADSGILQVRYLETSRDLDDQVLGTIMRYARFQLIMN